MKNPLKKLKEGDAMKRATLGLVLASAVVASWAATSAAAPALSVGDTVKTTANLNVRVAAGTGQPEISGSGYSGCAPAGTVGKVVAGPVSANGYTWYKVDYGSGRYTGWSVGDSLQKVQVAVAPPQPAPAAPAPLATPGSGRPDSGAGCAPGTARAPTPRRVPTPPAHRLLRAA